MKYSACFIGHRTIEDTAQLRERVRTIILELIENGTVNFLFGDHSAFNDLCYKIVTKLKETHPDVRRIKFRKDYEEPDEYTLRFLSARFEESICPPGVGRAGRASYVERNQAMIRESNVCAFYYDENYRPAGRTPGHQSKSGTAIAFQYAQSKQKAIINCFSPGDKS